MVLKWFHEVEEPKYQTLHSDEYSGYYKYAASPCGKHRKPRQFAYGYRKVMDAGNKLMTVDCQLYTLCRVFGDAPPESPEVARYFMKLLQMIQRFMESGIKWESDFHAGNICYCECSGVWKLVDLEKLETATAKAESAINTGARQTAITGRLLLVPIVFGPFLESE